MMHQFGGSCKSRARLIAHSWTRRAHLTAMWCSKRSWLGAPSLLVVIASVRSHSCTIVPI